MIKAALINKNTSEIIKIDNYPAILGDDGVLPKVQGLSEGLEWYIVVYDLKPQYDTNNFNLSEVFEISSDFHPVHTNLKQFKIHYNIVPKNIKDKKNILYQKERDINSNLFLSFDRIKLIYLALYVISKELSGKSLTLKEQQIKNKYLEVADKIILNHENYKNIQTRIDNNEEVDFNSGWIN